MFDFYFNCGGYVDSEFDDIEGQEDAVIAMIKADGVIGIAPVGASDSLSRAGFGRPRHRIKPQWKEQPRPRPQSHEQPKPRHQPKPPTRTLKITDGQIVGVGDLFQFCNRDGVWRDEILKCDGYGWATDEVRGTLLAVFTTKDRQQMWCPVDSCRKVFWVE
jgi:hypothetical protein